MVTLLLFYEAGGYMNTLLSKSEYQWIIQFFQNQFVNHEGMVALYFDQRSRLCSMHVIAKGMTSFGMLNLTTFFRGSLLINLPYIVIIHNHPRGILTPSEKDMVLTGKIRRGFSLLGLKLVDHLIVANNQIYSIFQHKIIFY